MLLNVSLVMKVTYFTDQLVSKDAESMSSLWMERASHALTVALNVTCTDASNAHTICGTKKECVSLPVPQATSKWISSKNATSVALTVLHV